MKLYKHLLVFNLQAYIEFLNFWGIINFRPSLEEPIIHRESRWGESSEMWLSTFPDITFLSFFSISHNTSLFQSPLCWFHVIFSFPKCWNTSGLSSLIFSCFCVVIFRGCEFHPYVADTYIYNFSPDSCNTSAY